MKLNIANRFIRELKSDPITSNVIRQVMGAHFSYVTPLQPSHPKNIHIAKEVALLAGLNEDDLKSSEFTSVFSGKEVYRDTHPFAMNYGGHQFGNWAGQLGDGRAITLFEADFNNQVCMFQLKGAGKTPYSRRGDGLAVLRSSIREHLCSEAMHHLGVPTSRSLSLLQTGDLVLRDMLYDGNANFEKGAVVCRIAPSFIRFGNFEIHAARNEKALLQDLADYTIRHYFKDITATGKEKYIAFFDHIAQTTRKLILEWQRVGFVHGVMNTDNMSVHGITIDYGPYGWLEDYNPNWTPNTTDKEHQRYAYGNQPEIGLWNLYQLANALYPLVEDVEPFEAILHAYPEKFEHEFKEMNCKKLGLFTSEKEDANLVNRLLNTLQVTETDYTIFFRLLGSILKSDTPEIMYQKISASFYHEPTEEQKSIWLFWFTQYQNRLQNEPQNDTVRKEAMNAVNPKYVLRNYMAQLAIEAAEQEDYTLIATFYNLLLKPYDEQPEYEQWFAKRPEWARTKVGCSMLSCSS